MAVNGNNIFVKANGALIGATRSNELTVDCETIEIASPTTGAWRAYIAGRKGWQITCSFLLTAVKPANISTNVSDTRNPLAVGATYTLDFVSRADSTDRVSGSAICTQCKITSTRGNLVNGTITFLGVTELS